MLEKQINAGAGLTNVKETLTNMFGGEHILRLLIDHPSASPSIASLGAGAAHFELQLAQVLAQMGKNPRLTLVDSSQAMCDLMKESSSHNKFPAEVLLADLLDWVKADGEFDCLILRNVAHFLKIDDFLEVLGRLKRLANRNNSIIYLLTASTFNSLSLSGETEKAFECLVQKKTRGGINIPDGTSMTFIDPDGDVLEFFTKQTELQVDRVDRVRYPAGSRISNNLDGDKPEAVGVFLSQNDSLLNK